MSSTTAHSYPESVGSCWPPTPPTPPPTLPSPAAAAAAPRSAPVRRQLDFAAADADAGAGLGDDLEYGEDIISAVDDIERGYEAKRRAPPCVCRRGECAVRRDEQGRWTYVCSSQPKCKYVALCEEAGLSPESQPAVRSHPKPSNPCVFNIPSNHVPEPRTPVDNVNPRGAGATTPINVSPQAPLNSTFQGAGTATPVHVPVPRTPVNNVNLRGAGATTPVNVNPRAPLNSTFQGAGSTAVVKVSPRGARSNDEWPTCKCTAGKCKVLRVNKEEAYYVCPIPKGKGACTQKVPVHVHAAANDLLQTGDDNTRGGDKDSKDEPAEKEAHGNNNLVRVGDNNANASVSHAQPEDSEWPFDIVNNDVVPTAEATPRAAVHQGSPSMLRQPIATVEKTPTKSPMPPYSTRSPMTPCSDSICFGCGEKGHWIKECPKPSQKNCFHCGMTGHWRSNCPQLRRS
ncbi:hypothetical protein SETIT_8G140400v2 [Setaria italica]|uniref:CCHC-type domain-containing protein n=1 Tax=Setaria italica TaxID=4555 RepID=A0A368S7K3_SETIT|nr:uncharacterized protein LOC101760655 [Setaria italica]RCV38412.1 hypothetical protein SETIT_8G140400v2 [Setaria italica]